MILQYDLFIEKSARKNLSKIPRPDQDRIIDAIRSLSTIPRSVGVKKLSGRDAWRIRIGNFRVIYEIDDDQLLILMVKIGHRKKIYRR